MYGMAQAVTDLIEQGAPAFEAAIPIRSQQHRRKVRFLSTIELVNALEQEKAKDKAGQIAEGMTKLDLVILDELGYL